MNTALIELGLSSFFTRQLASGELEQGNLARIIEVQRSGVTASNGSDSTTITLGGSWYQVSPDQRPTVGDWVLLDKPRQKIVRILERKSVFKRVAAGSRLEMQLLAANVDILFIVTSCNEEFKESRLERYLALALEADVEPVVVLTKADKINDPEAYLNRVHLIDASLSVLLVNALDKDSLGRLKAWVTDGTTVALVGSSGVGKSTILNTLTRSESNQTGAIREQDSKGRHTTSFRSLHRLPDGGLLLDVPGIRELKVAQLDSSLTDAFLDIDTLGAQCKYNDCAHNDEPGCAVRQAIGDGEIDERRLSNYRKLVDEEARNTASLTEQRQRSRQFTRTIKQHVGLKRKFGVKKGP